jgi:4-alpha-glucanotransferase
VLVDRAWARFGAAAPVALHEGFAAFRTAEARWLDDFVLFAALKEAHGGRAWADWPEPIRLRRPGALAEARRTRAAAMEREAFAQFLFFRQWEALRRHAAGRGVRVVGDVPIFVAHDSADVWAHPDLFRLDPAGRPAVVAGVPPDYFTKTGQRWGNPLYDWERHARTGYAWWIDRLRTALRRVDLARLDHFRGFVACWEVSPEDATAARGRWAAGPGAPFLEALRGALGDLPLIAEDLGDITIEVEALRDAFGLPGMKVMQFAFTGADNPFLPHRHRRRCVVYTGTHDNDTTRGWYGSAPEEVRDFCRRYLGRDGSDIAWDLLRAAWGSVAAMAVAPMQDLLDLDSRARMNHPGGDRGNWTWRMADGALTGPLQARLRDLNDVYGRTRGAHRPTAHR